MNEQQRKKTNSGQKVQHKHCQNKLKLTIKKSCCLITSGEKKAKKHGGPLRGDTFQPKNFYK